MQRKSNEIMQIYAKIKFWVNVRIFMNVVNMEISNQILRHFGIELKRTQYLTL